MATIKQLRLQARLTIDGLSKLAHVDRKTVIRAEEGQPILDTKAYAIAQALSGILDRDIDFEDIEDLVIK